MFGQLLLALALGLALVQAPVNAATARCCAEPSSHQVSVLDGCCAAMTCCVISDGTADKSVTPTTAANEISVSPPSPCFVSLIEFPASQSWSRLAKALPVAHAPPPLALLCTYLI